MALNYCRRRPANCIPNLSSPFHFCPKSHLKCCKDCVITWWANASLYWQVWSSINNECEWQYWEKRHLVSGWTSKEKQISASGYFESGKMLLEKLEMYKARLVFRGFTQMHGIDYHETYPPIARLESFWLLIAIVNCKGWPLDTSDFDSAYLNSLLSDNETIYLEQPKNFSKRPQEIRQSSPHGLVWSKTGCAWLVWDAT